MNRGLFLAILSMDSYNRGYGVGIKGLGGLEFRGHEFEFRGHNTK